MRVAALLRGFPGLGRVVAGLEVLKVFQEQYGAETQVFSYLQGSAYCRTMSIPVHDNIIDIGDLSGIGLIPVSPSGERVISLMQEWRPDIILCDGEPLMTRIMSLFFDFAKVVSILNPYDVINPFNAPSSQLFFQDCYGAADLALVHGLWSVYPPPAFTRDFHSLPTIIRSEVLDLKQSLHPDNNRIVCVLGGGSQRTNQRFLHSTITLGKACLGIADGLKEYHIEIFTGDSEVGNALEIASHGQSNVIIHKEICAPQKIYDETRLIIARAGRNVMSELLYLNLPAVVMATDCSVRGSEQKTNQEHVLSLGNGNLLSLEPMAASDDLWTCVTSLLGQKPIDTQWQPGNVQLLNVVAQLGQSGIKGSLANA